MEALQQWYEITPLQGIEERCKGRIKFIDDAAKADVAIVAAGLNHDIGNDAESEDRELFELPLEQVTLIKETAKENANTVVVLISGSPVGMQEWAGEVPSILAAWYPGMEGGRAIARIIFGDVNPSGKLPITFPLKLEDSPAHSGGNKRTYPGDDNLKVYYEEGIDVGYRFFDTRNIDPIFPFGFGMSYSDFKYQNLRISKKSIESMKDHLVVSVDVTNSGPVIGAEVVQVYASQNQSKIHRPPRELVGFQKIMLESEQTVAFSMKIQAKDLAYYNTEMHGWRLSAGEIELHVGSASRCEFLSETMVCYDERD